jgi:hypothetical protein
MRKYLVLTMLLLTVVLTACSVAKPQISLEMSEFDFEDVVNGVIVTKDVVVTNSGQSDLVVETVTTTCGCTTATLNPMKIRAGGTATLHIEFDSGAHGPELTGQIMRQVILISNDPEQPEATVELVANILPPEGQ